MAVNVTFLGVTYTIPTTGEEDWGDDLTAFLVALGNNSASGVSLTSVGAAPNANGASISGTVLNLQPSDATHPGVNTILAQTYAGVKTFSSSPVLSTSSHVRATQASGQSFANNTALTVVFDVKAYDTQSEYSTGTGIFTAAQTGIYLVSAAVTFTGDTPQAGDLAFILAQVNGVTQALGRTTSAEAAVSQNLNVNISTTLSLNATDQLKIVVDQHSGAGNPRTLSAAAADNYLTIDRLF